MKKTTEFKYENVDASPVKSFFVSMLTRDISLEEAILDLLDNCVDGILRSHKPSKSMGKPYQGFRAEIEFTKDSFTISDNCGGIPWDLHKYAFRMGRVDGRPADTKGTVGVYGIGMKRAIFKMGRQCLISTQNGEHSYEVEIGPDWVNDEGVWTIPVRKAKRLKGEDGTTVYISDLYDGIRSLFEENVKDFKSGLDRMISTHYAFIIDKGFEVKINNTPVKPKPTQLIFQHGKNTIKPFIFKTKKDGVEVFLAVGFTRPIPPSNIVEDAQEETKYSSIDAGWTVLCNDRAVLYCDRSELTGWGEAGVARYHTQFIAISGIVDFRANDASKLPTTTTKRGIDASSPLYLQIKNKMREGMRIFIDYTNKWKGRAEESKKYIEAGEPFSLMQIREASKSLKFTSTTRSATPGQQYKPNLPLPKNLESSKRRISFTKDITEIRGVSGYLFEDVDTDPSIVGEKCFDLISKEARNR